MPERASVPLRERLAGFESSPIAAWVSSVDPLAIIWANGPALVQWNALDLDELRRRDFSNASEASLTQARAWRESFRAGTLDVAQTDWTLYPHGVPKRVRIFTSGVLLDDGDHGLLQQAIPMDAPIDPEILRGAEAIRHISTAVVLLSQTGEVLSRNPAMIHAFGPDTPPSRWFEELGAYADILAVARHGQLHRAELSSRRSGQRRAYSLEARKTQDPVSGHDVILVHIQDETARLGAELDAERKGQRVDELQALLARVEAQEQRWRALVESAPDLIAIIDRAHRVVFSNHRLAPRSPQASEPQVRAIEQLFNPDAREQLSAAIERVFETGQIHSLEARTSGPGGTRQHSIRLGPIGADGQVERLMLIASDVTEHHALEHQLRHSQKMQAVGTLAGGVAHDFNNLLTIIMGSCELAALTCTQNHPAQPLLDEITAAAHRAARLTHQLLAFSRKQVLQPKRIDLNLLVGDLSRLLARVIRGHINLVLNLEPRSCWILADPGQIEQVAMNLIVNARDAMPEGGTLTIATRYTGDELLLEVADTGVGMSPELQSRIFDPFFTTKDTGQGTGLGLSMVHGIVEQSGGRIELHSEPGRGTRVEVYLPRAPGPESGPARGPGPGDALEQLPVTRA